LMRVGAGAPLLQAAGAPLPRFAWRGFVLG